MMLLVLFWFNIIYVDLTFFEEGELFFNSSFDRNFKPSLEHGISANLDDLILVYRHCTTPP